MTEPNDWVRRYLEQRIEAGDDRFFLSARRVPKTPKPAAQPPGAPEPKPAPRSKPPQPGARWLKDAPPVPDAGIVVAPPAKDLFTDDPLRELDLEGVADRVRVCTQCSLAEHRTHAVPGEGPAHAQLAVVGEGPGAKEDETGRPFVGRAGELLTDILKAIELPREHVFICNVVKCRPPNNRTPQQEEIEACVPYLYRQLEKLAPRVILAMGGTAAQTLLQTRQSLGALRNKVHQFRGIPLVVTYHPAALLRNPHWKKPTWDDVRIARQLLGTSG